MIEVAFAAGMLVSMGLGVCAKMLVDLHWPKAKRRKIVKTEHVIPDEARPLVALAVKEYMRSGQKLVTVVQVAAEPPKFIAECVQVKPMRNS